MPELVQLAVSEGVATVAFNRPERMNAMTDPLLEELLAAPVFRGS
jgi:enoyl-CoA hydratase/carnithine racemase